MVTASAIATEDDTPFTIAVADHASPTAISVKLLAVMETTVFNKPNPTNVETYATLNPKLLQYFPTLTKLFTIPPS